MVSSIHYLGYCGLTKSTAITVQILCANMKTEGEFPCSYCELNGNCKFFPNLDETPDNKMVTKMWLESEVE